MIKIAKEKSWKNFGYKMQQYFISCQKKKVVLESVKEPML